MLERELRERVHSLQMEVMRGQGSVATGAETVDNAGSIGIARDLGPASVKVQGPEEDSAERGRAARLRLGSKVS